MPASNLHSASFFPFRPVDQPPGRYSLNSTQPLAVFLGKLMHQNNHLGLNFRQHLVRRRHIQVLGAPIFNLVLPAWEL